ncbi:hypothetical protein [Kitasatospora sp. NPDC005748]|uniref:hypothetical protein n=1 Tax=Kitasatospora sp. NPDC005748 TaxID=3157063 RepID=UPI0033C10F83
MIASWNGSAPDPAPEGARGPRDTLAKLAAHLDLPVNALAPDRRPAETVWHCSLRNAAEDRILTDAEWATIARRILHATDYRSADQEHHGTRHRHARHRSYPGHWPGTVRPHPSTLTPRRDRRPPG